MDQYLDEAFLYEREATFDWSCPPTVTNYMSGLYTDEDSVDTITCAHSLHDQNDVLDTIMAPPSTKRLFNDACLDMTMGHHAACECPSCRPFSCVNPIIVVEPPVTVSVPVTDIVAVAEPTNLQKPSKKRKSPDSEVIEEASLSCATQDDFTMMEVDSGEKSRELDPDFMTLPAARPSRAIVHGGVGIVTPPTYNFMSIPFVYDKEPLVLSVATEEAMALFFTSSRSHRQDSTFCANFLTSLGALWLRDFGVECPIKHVGLCDFFGFRDATENGTCGTFWPKMIPRTVYDNFGAKHSIETNYAGHTSLVSDWSQWRGTLVPHVTHDMITINITHAEDEPLATTYPWKSVVKEPLNDYLAWWTDPVTQKLVYIKVANPPRSNLLAFRCFPSSRRRRLNSNNLRSQDRTKYFDLTSSKAFGLSLMTMRQSCRNVIEHAYVLTGKCSRTKPPPSAFWGKNYLKKLYLALAAWFVDGFGLDILPSHSHDVVDCLSLRVCDIKLGSPSNVDIRIKIDSEQKLYSKQAHMPVQTCSDKVIYTVCEYIMKLTTNFDAKIRFCQHKTPFFATITPVELYKYVASFFPDGLRSAHITMRSGLDLAIRTYNMNTVLAHLAEDGIRVPRPIYRRIDCIDKLEVDHHPVIQSFSDYLRAVEYVVLNFFGVITLQGAANKPVYEAYLAKEVRLRNALVKLLSWHRKCTKSQIDPLFVTDVVPHVCDVLIQIWSLRMSAQGVPVASPNLRSIISMFDPRIVTSIAAKYNIPLVYAFGGLEKKDS